MGLYSGEGCLYTGLLFYQGFAGPIFVVAIIQGGGIAGVLRYKTL